MDSNLTAPVTSDKPATPVTVGGGVPLAVKAEQVYGMPDYLSEHPNILTAFNELRSRQLRLFTAVYSLGSGVVAHSDEAGGRLATILNNAADAIPFPAVGPFLKWCIKTYFEKSRQHCFENICRLFSSPEDISAFSAELAEKICRTFENQINNLSNDSDVRTFARVVFALLQSYIMGDLPKVNCAMNDSQRAACLEDCFISIITRPEDSASKSITDTVIDMLNKSKFIKKLLDFMDIESDTVRWKGQDRNALKLLYNSCYVETSANINSTADSSKANSSTNSTVASVHRYFGFEAEHASKYGFRNSDICPSGFKDITKGVDDACAPMASKMPKISFLSSANLNAQIKADLDNVRTVMDGFSERLKAVEGDVTALQVDFDVLQGQVDELRGGIDGVQSSMAIVQDNVAIVQVDVEVVRSNVAKVQDNVATVQGNVAKVATDVSGMQSSLAKLQGNFGTLICDFLKGQGSVSEARAEFAKLKVVIAEQKVEAVKSKKDVVKLRSDVDQLQKGFTKLEGKVDKLEISTTKTQDDLAGVKAGIADVKADVKAHVSFLQDDLANVQGNVIDVLRDVGEVRGDVAEVRGDVAVLHGRFENLTKLADERPFQTLRKVWTVKPRCMISWGGPAAPIQVDGLNHAITELDMLVCKDVSVADVLILLCTPATKAEADLNAAGLTLDGLAKKFNDNLSALQKILVEAHQRALIITPLLVEGDEASSVPTVLLSLKPPLSTWVLNIKNDVNRQLLQQAEYSKTATTRAGILNHLVTLLYGKQLLKKIYTGDTFAKVRLLFNDQLAPLEEIHTKTAVINMCQSPQQQEALLKAPKPLPLTGLHDNLVDQFETVQSPDGKPVVELKEILGTALRTLVLGRPGIGKSVLLQKLVNAWAKGELLQEYTWVLLLRLRDPTLGEFKTDSLSELIRTLSLKNDLPVAAIDDVLRHQGRRVLLLLDGFDEFNDRSDALKQLIAGATDVECYASCSILLTSRPAALDKLNKCGTIFERTLEVVGFGIDDIKEFVKRFLRKNAVSSTTPNADAPFITGALGAVDAATNSSTLSSTTAATTDAEELINYLDAHPTIQGLVHVPIMAAIICTVWQSAGRKIASTMTGIFKQLGSCLEQAARRRGVEWIMEEHVEAAGIFLGRLAWAGLRHGDGQLLFSDGDFSRLVPQSKPDVRAACEKVASVTTPERFRMDKAGAMSDAYSVIKKAAIELGWLNVDKTGERSGSRVYYFLHLTLQEYMAAAHLVRRSTGPSARKVWFDSNHRFDVVWQFCCGLLGPDAGGLLTGIVSKASEGSRPRRRLCILALRCQPETKFQDLIYEVKRCCLPVDAQDQILTKAIIESYCKTPNGIKTLRDCVKDVLSGSTMAQCMPNPKTAKEMLTLVTRCQNLLDAIKPVFKDGLLNLQKELLSLNDLATLSSVLKEHRITVLDLTDCSFDGVRASTVAIPFISQAKALQEVRRNKKMQVDRV